MPESIFGKKPEDPGSKRRHPRMSRESPGSPISTVKSMAIIRKRSSTKRFGVRYGRSNRDKLAAVEELHRRWLKCPYCSKETVRRVTAGIWHCKKCNATFAGRAYTIAKRKSTAELTASEEQFESMIKETAAEVEMPEEENSFEKEEEA